MLLFSPPSAPHTCESMCKHTCTDTHTQRERDMLKHTHVYKKAL